MKSINQIFRDNTSLMNEPEVKELIEYCQELEGKVMDTEMMEQYSMENKLTFLVREIYESCVEDLERDEENERWPDLNDKPDFKFSIQMLKRYIQNFARDNNFRL